MNVHRAAGILLIDDEKRMILQHRDAGAPTHPNTWALFGGRIEDGESPEEGAIREIKEELGVKVELTFFKKYLHEQDKGVYEQYVFTAPLQHSLEQLKSQQTEGDDVGLFSFEETKTLKMPDTDRIVLEEINSLSSS